LYSFIVVRVRVVILNEVKNLDPSLTLLDDSSIPAVHNCLLKMFISSMGIARSGHILITSYCNNIRSVFQ